MKKSADTRYAHAFALAVNGYSVMPVGLDKKPLLRSWKEYQSKRPTDEQITAWWKQFPEANIGIVTGKVSGITVVDLDVKDGVLLTPLDKFPKTFTVRTGNGGYHLYYQYQPGLTISAGAYPQYPGVDMRSDGGFVVGPFSQTKYKDAEGRAKGGTYEIISNIPAAPFPAHLFPKPRERRALHSMIGVSTGGRNDSIASFAGKLLQSSAEKEWESEVWPAVERANATYSPPLKSRELRTTFESIMKKEAERRGKLIISPIQAKGDGTATDPDAPAEDVEIAIRKNKAGIAYKDMANVLAVLAAHPYYRDTIRYNEFKQEIEYRGKPLEEGDLVKIQYFMQTDAELHGINKEAVHAAIQHYANQHSYDEAQEWIRKLEWDGVKRLGTWVSRATGVTDDPYHAGIGSQWFAGLIRRLMVPGSTFDYVLVMVGPQGIGKTSLFRIIGGPWYKSYTGAMDNKDFYLALRGAAIVDLDEGAALSRSDAIKIKSIITETHDEYRAPYDRVMKKYPRRFVFSMSTNDTEPFRDVTGNRRYWTIDGERQIDFKWLEENRSQLFAEAYHAFKGGITLPEVPFDIAREKQETHLPEDSWTDLVVNEVQKSPEYCRGDLTYSTTITDIFSKIFPEESLVRLGKSQEMRIANIFKKTAGLEKRREMVDGERKVRWMIMPQKAEELSSRNASDTRDDFDKYGTEDA